MSSNIHILYKEQNGFLGEQWKFFKDEFVFGAYARHIGVIQKGFIKIFSPDSILMRNIY